MPPSSTRSPDGGRDTSRSARTGRSRSIRPRTPADRSTSSSWSTICSGAASACRRSSGFATSSQHRLQDISEAFQARDRAARVLGPLHLRLPDQGQPAAAGRRRGARSSDASISSASRPAPSRSCWPWWRSPTTRRRSSATASRTPSSSRWRCWRRRSAGSIIPVVEKYTELDLILEYAEKVGVRPTIGMRVKLAARGGGRWQSSGGYRSKFGLTVGEILRGLEELKTRGHGGLLPAAALSPRQPDPQHPHRQRRR